MIVVIDNYDSFTYNIVQYLGEMGVELKVVRNDQITLEQRALRRPQALKSLDDLGCAEGRLHQQPGSGRRAVAIAASCSRSSTFTSTKTAGSVFTHPTRIKARNATPRIEDRIAQLGPRRTVHAAAVLNARCSPPGVGATMMISGTPATLAGMAFISTEEGYAALPPGT